MLNNLLTYITYTVSKYCITVNFYDVPHDRYIFRVPTTHAKVNESQMKFFKKVAVQRMR